jgi:YbbR domain-containing protein
MKIPFLHNGSAEKKRIHLNRRFITFLFCIAISTFFWLMMSLSKEYVIELNFPVSYINPPADKVIANRLPSTIDIEIRSTGFNILIYKLKHRKEVVQVDIKDSKPLPVKNHYYLTANSRIDKITRQFDNDIKVLKVFPDTIFLNFNKKVAKKVPVKANLKIVFNKHYQQSDSVKIVPDFITISGAADVVNKINYVETEPVSLKNVNDSLAINLHVIKNTQELKQVDLSQPTVRASVNVTKFTEGNIELPIEVENLPKGYSLKIFPDKVSVKYHVAFQNYEKINALQFRAVVDYTRIEQGSTKLKVQLLKFPAEVSAVKLNPEKVEYIIRK